MVPISKVFKTPMNLHLSKNILCGYKKQIVMLVISHISKLDCKVQKQDYKKKCYLHFMRCTCITILFPQNLLNILISICQAKE